MQPALSVIFFTVVSGCGYGLLFLVALAGMLDPPAVGRAETLVALVAGAVLAAAGLTSSLLHLGKPRRAWRAFSQWRSSWLSREGVASVITFVPLAALGFAAWSGAAPVAARALAVVLAAMAGATVYCTARIYSSLKTIHAWHNAYVVPGYLLFALLGGGAALWTLDAAFGAATRPDHDLLPVAVAVLGAATALLKRGYWNFIDADAGGSSPESATGLGRFGRVRSAEAPHTEHNYLTREMGFVLARVHAQRLRVIAIVLFALVPLAAAAATYFLPATALAMGIAAAAAIVAGAFVERWLFFAQARHVVMRYYET